MEKAFVIKQSENVVATQDWAPRNILSNAKLQVQKVAACGQSRRSQVECIKGMASLYRQKVCDRILDRGVKLTIL